MIEDEDDFYEAEDMFDSEEYGPGPLSGVSDLDPKPVIQSKAAALPPMANETNLHAKVKGKRGRQAVQPRKAKKRTAHQRDEEFESDDDGESDSMNILSSKHTDSDNLCGILLNIVLYRYTNF